MDPKQKEMLIGKANLAKDKVATLWKSGTKGKAIIIGAAVVVLGLVGSCFNSSDEEASESSAEVSESGTTSKPKVAAKKPKQNSILNIVPTWNERDAEHREICKKFRNAQFDDGKGHKIDPGHAHCAVRISYIQRLYEEDFRSPITTEMAKIDPSKPRYSLFGGTLKAGMEIEIPANVQGRSFNYDMDGRTFYFTCRLTNSGMYVPVFADDIEVWEATFTVKEFMGLENAKSMWYRAPGSNKLVMFYAMVRNNHANNGSKGAQETRQRMIEAVQKKYSDMEHTFQDEISDEYTYNGDVLTVEQSVQLTDMSVFDAPWVQVGIITPSIVVKILESCDKQDAIEFEAAKKADSGALEGF